MRITKIQVCTHDNYYRSVVVSFQDLKTAQVLLSALKTLLTSVALAIAISVLLYTFITKF